ncbi:MAG TPA: DUF998 domain-containing protein [Plantibacter sp.]|uniref:DUF998 domain-containing protein n=1 Tax=unclassified Plantibacter TaxID=2624265 RepID=UPI002C62E16F|nr:DUF998 domain-containing protein [Plantibacter sp.]
MSVLFAQVAAVLFVIRLVVFVTLHLRPAGIHPVRDTVSDYAASSSAVTRALSTCSSWAAAAGWAALGLSVLVDPALGAQRVPVGTWLIVLAVVLSVMPWVPTDGPGQRTTLRGRVHLLLAVGWFTIAYATIGPLGRLLGGSGLTGAGGVLSVLDTIAMVALIALVVSLLVRPLRSRTFGLAERVFILVVTLAPLVAGLGIAAG